MALEAMTRPLDVRRVGWGEEEVGCERVVPAWKSIVSGGKGVLMVMGLPLAYVPG